MTLSNKKRQIRKYFRRWHAVNNIHKCVVCGADLYDTLHHIFCNSCHANTYKFWDKDANIMLFPREFIEQRPENYLILRSTDEYDSLNEQIFEIL